MTTLGRVHVAIAGWLALLISGASAADEITFTAANDGSQQKYVELLPAGLDAKAPVDVLIALHGHGSDRWQFIRQQRDECRAVRDVARRHGMILVSPDYRAPTSWMGPRAEADLVQIIHELKERHAVRRVLLCGASMGGASCLTFAALHPDLVDGVASMNGTANHVEYENFQAAIRRSFGGTKTEVPDEYRKRSAELHPQRLTMPTAFTVGGKDRSVPPDSVRRLARKLEKAGRLTRLIDREDGGHSTTYRDAVAILEFIVDRKAVAKPNLVFFLVDDLGWTDLGCYGSDYYETPNIDRLAAKGVRFTDAYAACNACSPTRAAILTGMYPARLRLTDWIPGQRTLPTHAFKPPPWTPYLEHRHVTLAEALKAQGYTTWHVGKWHLGGPDYYPKKQGFDVNMGGSFIGAPGSYYYPYYRKPGTASGPVENLPPQGPEGRYLTDRLTDEAVRLIEQPQSQPFFLYFSYYSVHTPIQPRSDLRDRYRKMERGKRHQNPDYAAMVAAVDESVGRVVKCLEETGRIENTVIVFTSDNGGMHKVTTNAPLRGGKGMAWEGGTRVPLIVSVPEMQAAGRTSAEPVISMDFYPTLLEMAGRPNTAPQAHDGSIDGVSLAPLLRDPAAGLNRDAIYWHYPHYNVLQGVPHSSLRAGRYKLIEFFEGSRVELYDLEDDLGEQTDLASRLPEQTARLTRMLHDWRESVGAQMPIPK